MPLYEYRCRSCEKVTESLRPAAEADQPLACEHCGKKQTERIHSVFAAPASQGSAPAPGPCGGCNSPTGSCPFN